MIRRTEDREREELATLRTFHCLLVVKVNRMIWSIRLLALAGVLLGVCIWLK